MAKNVVPSMDEVVDLKIQKVQFKKHSLPHMPIIRINGRKGYFTHGWPCCDFRRKFKYYAMKTNGKGGIIINFKK